MSDYKPPALRPMDIADIIDAAVRLYRANFRPFLSIIAIVYVPMAVFQVLLAFAMGRMAQTMPKNPTQLPLQHLATMGVAYMGLILLNVLAVPIAQGALAVAVSRRYLNYPATVADAYGTIGTRWGALIAAVMLVGMVAMTGTLLCLVPGVYLGIMWMFITPIIAIEGLSVMGALRRSWDLVSGEWWRCFSTYLLLSLLVGLVTGAVSWPVSGLAVVVLGEKQMALAQALATGIGTVVGIVVQPVLIIGLVMLYYDLRIRKEGFDLQVLARAMNVPASEVPTYEAYVQTPPLLAYAPGGATVPPELLDYVRQAQAAGMTYEETRKKLIAGGWPASQLDRDLPLAWAEPATPPTAWPPPPAVAPSQEPSAETAPTEPDPFAPEGPPPDYTSEQP